MIGPRQFAYALALALLGCAPATDARFAAAEARANATTRAGHHAEAGERWLEAARAADSSGDRDEALFRAAASFARAGRDARALELYATLASGTGERSARASFDRARLVGRSDPARGDVLLVAALRRHPSSGLAPRALREHLAYREADGGTSAALEASTRLVTELGASELDETLRYERALLLERAGSPAEARAAYLDVAARHPYPRGALWDDALARAAELELRLGRPRAAIELFERLLAEREAATSLGSYERVRYAEARFRIAEIQRDRLGDPSRARHEFRRVFTDHPTSRLRDDALWQEALTAARNADPGDACEPLGLLVKYLPDSRYTPCAPRLCASVKTVARACHLAEAELAPPRVRPAAGDHSSSSSSSSSSSL